jgi:hypothetical protein
MDGMGFLLNSLGIDPEQLKTAASQVQSTALDFLARLDRIEKKVDTVIFNQSVLELQLNKILEDLNIDDDEVEELTNGRGSDNQGGNG